MIVAIGVVVVGGLLVELYVPEKVSWAIRYHQALRFYPDAPVRYE